MFTALPNKNLVRIRHRMNILVVLFSTLIVLVLVPQREEAFKDSYNILLSIIAIGNVLFLWSTVSRYILGWIRFDTLFLLGYLIVHFQSPFLLSFGLEPPRAERVFINHAVIDYATWLSTLSLLLWILGYLLMLRQNGRTVKPDLPDYRVNTKLLDILLVFLLVLLIATATSDFWLGNHRGDANWGIGFVYVYPFLRMFLFLRIIYFFNNTKKIPLSKLSEIFLRNGWFFTVLIIYFMIFLGIGDRGPIMHIGILMLTMFSLYRKKIPLRVFILFIILGAIIFTLIGMGRGTHGGVGIQGILSQGASNLQSQEGLLIPTTELASSNRILYRALDVVPENYPYLGGITFAYRIASVIPFGEYIMNTIFETPLMFQASAYFFTILGSGEDFVFGEGSEILADIYINWGTYGVFIVLFLFGCITGALSMRVTVRPSHRWIIVYGLLMISAVYLNRADILQPIRTIAYALIIDFLFARRTPVSHEEQYE